MHRSLGDVSAPMYSPHAVLAASSTIATCGPRITAALVFLIQLLGGEGKGEVREQGLGNDEF